MNLKIDHIIWIIICMIEIILSFMFMRSGAKTTALVLLVFTFLSLGRLFVFEEINKALFTSLIILYDNLKILYKHMSKAAMVGKERVYSHIIKDDLNEALNELFDIESYWRDVDNYE